LTGANSIAKSVSIVADGVVAGIQATSGGDAIDVTGSGVTVVLRGLTLDGVGFGGQDGIFVSSASSAGALYLEDCTINGFSDGIIVEPGSGNMFISIKDTIVRNNANRGIEVLPLGAATVTASFDNVRTEKNYVGVAVDPNATVSVRNSVVAGNSIGLGASSTGGAAVINLESSIASGNGTGVKADGANSTINITNVTVVNNTTGLSELNGGHIVSFGNNKVTDNTTNGSPTKTISQH
jgi:hypothetical protein